MADARAIRSALGELLYGYAAVVFDFREPKKENGRVDLRPRAYYGLERLWRVAGGSFSSAE